MKQDKNSAHAGRSASGLRVLVSPWPSVALRCNESESESVPESDPASDAVKSQLTGTLQSLFGDKDSEALAKVFRIPQVTSFTP